MKRQNAFDVVRRIGLTLPEVEAGSKYDGSPVLRLRGCLLAGLATHQSAEPDSLVVRAEPGNRDLLIADAPDTYYVTEYYQRHPIVLVRLGTVSEDALRELLRISWRLTEPKTRRNVRRKGSEG
jgi:hypothetical protein